MDFGFILDNLANPAILFFGLGLLAVLFKSDLEIPQPIPKLLSLYLLLAIGYKGGVELRHGAINATLLLTLAAAMLMATVVPLYSFFILKWKLSVPNAAALAATYGSVSAVTFITATSFLNKQSIPFGGHMVAAMALMESPSIIVGVLLYRLYSTPQTTNGQTEPRTGIHWGELLRDAFLNGAVFLLVGSLIIGIVSNLRSGDPGKTALQPLIYGLFQGVLALFLLDMGLVAGRQIKALRSAGVFLVAFAICVPLFNASLALLLGKLIGIGPGDAILLCVLCASASYIAVPAAVRIAIPDANPSLYVSMALAVTFPFNIIIGIPLYAKAVSVLWS